MELFFIWMKRIWALGFAVFATYILYSAFHTPSCKSILADQLRLNFDGIVVAKRKPALSHSSFYIDLIAQGDSLTYLVEKRGTEEEFWNSVPIGARVSKRASSPSFVITKPNGQAITHVFICNE
ncbi:hypothetical protein [Hymenobacter cellulosilyticus]|uniref:Uncharacterized protein n=1 Tax=Hymenobacter cellulosilyticus TaxID=2932248 RepID=A0A8T9Q473_9BACT|nr:hypothetical protein [Hymenobacter cellulosilyticus]UOQ70279.1 hypothetical protein MUN79_16150 [Hymenobacter cellulosilyticus]